jgi:hypothetical protein
MRNMSKNTKIFIAIGIVAALAAGIWLVIALAQPKPIPFDPASPHPPIADSSEGRDDRNPILDLDHSPAPVSPAGKGIQDTVTDVPQQNSLYFSDVILPFIDDVGVNPGGGFVLKSKEKFVPNEELRTVIFPRGESASSQSAYAGKPITINAQGGLDAVYPLPAKLSLGTYTLEVSSSTKKFVLNFTLIATGTSQYDGPSSQ